jgi:magnesium transporter
MQRQKLVMTLVQKQHLAELQALIKRLSAFEIGQILSSLSLEDTQFVWEQVAAERQDDVLWEISDTLREYLVGDREPHCGEGQLSAFQLVDGRLTCYRLVKRSDY